MIAAPVLWVVMLAACSATAGPIREPCADNSFWVVTRVDRLP